MSSGRGGTASMACCEMYAFIRLLVVCIMGLLGKLWRFVRVGGLREMTVVAFGLAPGLGSLGSRSLVIRQGCPSLDRLLL